MKTKWSLLIFCSVVLFSSCYYDNEEMLYGLQTCDTSNVKYSVQIANTIAASCISCHSGAGASGGIRLNTYTDVRNSAMSGRLLGSITHAPGFRAMPDFSPKLPECRIAEIRTWIRNGMLDN